MFGHHGQYLRIDLSQNRSAYRELPPDVLRRFIGGVGIGVYLLMREGDPCGDPTAAEAPIIFSFSPLVGSPLTTSAKFAVVSKSPLTDRINDSLASSGLALAGKKTGCDAICIVGRAAEPSVLVIDNGRVELQPAQDLWGTTCTDAQQELRERFGPGWQFAVIGPAGEHLVRFATISHDGRHAGRGGSGAVFGSKNIKAMAVRGNHRVNWAEPEQLVQFSKELSRRSFGPATAKYRELGTAANLLSFNRLNCLPTRNFQHGSFAGAERLSPESLSQTRTKTQASCVACTIGCEHIYALSTNDASNAVEGSVRLEYESLFALGSLCGIDDPDVVLAAAKRCDELGIDTISAGGTIAFAMDCVERGLLDDRWPKFGDGASLLAAIDSIGDRSGIGEGLAEGSRRLARSIGHGAAEFAPHVKGLEIPGYEPRTMQTMALGFAVGTRGADHNRSGAYEVDFSSSVDRRAPADDAIRMAVETEDKATLMDSLILCKFLRGALDDFFEDASKMLNLVTGWQTTSCELAETSQRIITAKKLFNVRAGWTPAEDVLPKRFFTESLADDSAHLDYDTFRQHVSRYNLLRGWNHDGLLSCVHLEQMGLSDL